MKIRCFLQAVAMLPMFIASPLLQAEKSDAVATPPVPNFSPGAEYADSARMFQGIPGIERAANGRLWACWYGGGTGEDLHNYIMLVTSADDGRTWSSLKLVLDPDGDGPVRAFDPCLWHDPSGRLWLFWAQRADAAMPQLFAMSTSDATSADPAWSKPVRIADGIMMNKPTVATDGSWLLPTALWKREGSSRVVRSADQGKTWEFIGSATIPEPKNRNCDENMIVQRRGGSLWMLVRTGYGIGETTSTDGGKTWSDVVPSTIPHAASRFFIRRLASGKLLLIRHNAPDTKTRSHLTAYLSDDDGKTWSGGLLLDERKGISYPDAVEGPAGEIRVIYDFDRYHDKQILMAVISESDVASGKASASTRLQVLVNHATGVIPDKPARPAKKDAAKPAATTTGLSADAFGVTTLTPPVLNVNPGPRYWPRLRLWQGIPGIERTPKGRLWATWYTGPLGEGKEGNHAVLVTSADDGKTWSNPVAVFDPTPFFGGNTGDPHLWIDPQGRLWWFINRVLKVSDPNGVHSMWGFCLENPEEDTPRFSAPVFAGYGVGLNKPTALADGTWLAPVDSFNSQDPQRTQVYASRDRGQSFSLLGKLPVKDGTFSEHQIVERKDGSLLLLTRTSYGIGQSESFDHGATWVNDHLFTTERGVNTRFFFTKLKSGALLLVVNDHPRKRTNMTAMLSEDEGRTWPYKLLLDDRDSVSYPDGVEGTNGFLYITYDRGRYNKDEQEILFAKITEADVKAGRLVNEGSQMRQVINRLADFGGGVRVSRESQLMQEEFEKTKTNTTK